MNRKQLFLILIALVIIGGLGLVLTQRNKESWSGPQDKTGAKLFPNFPLNDVAAIAIKGAGELDLVRKDGVWRVAQRGDYPANYSTIRDFLIKMGDLKITQSEPVGPSQLPHLQLEPPGAAVGAGTLLEFKDEHGKTLQSVLLGRKHTETSTSPSPFGGGDFANGRYVMLPPATNELLLISDPMNNADVPPEPWLNHDFLKIVKPSSVSFVSTNASNSWQLARDSEAAPWVLADLKPGEVLDSNKVASLAGTLGEPNFVDIATNTAPSATGLDKPLMVTIKTFDQFTYLLKVGSKTPENDYYVNFDVSADLATQRTPGKDEKPEDKAKLDKAFQDNLKALQAKLDQEKALGKWVYVINSWLVDPLIRDRAQLFVEKKEEKPAVTGSGETIPETSPGATNLPEALPLTPPATNSTPGSAPK